MGVLGGISEDPKEGNDSGTFKAFQKWLGLILNPSQD